VVEEVLVVVEEEEGTATIMIDSTMADKKEVFKETIQIPTIGEDFKIEITF
jgi:hypothetical protein